MSPEEMISKYLIESGIKISAVSKKSGVSYSRLQPSLRGTRPMRADEFLNVCSAMGWDANRFCPQKRASEGEHHEAGNG